MAEGDKLMPQTAGGPPQGLGAGDTPPGPGSTNGTGAGAGLHKARQQPHRG